MLLCAAAVHDLIIINVASVTADADASVVNNKDASVVVLSVKYPNCCERT